MAGAVKRALVYKLILVENARNALNEELHDFTEKTAEEIEEFLNSSVIHSSHPQDGENLLKTLDDKYHLIQHLMSVFEDLKSAPEPCKRLPHMTSHSPQHGFRLHSKGTQVFFPHVSKFGLFLQNAIQASSIKRAVQVVSSTLSIQHLTSSIEAKEESVEPIISPDDDAEDGINKQDQSEAECVAAEPENHVVTPNVVMFKELHEKDPEVQHQKQTSSQLVGFLRKNTRPVALEMDLAGPLAPKIKKRPDLNQWDALGHINPQKHTRSELYISEPIFKLKSSTSTSLTYSCVIATHSQLWDIGDVSTEVKTPQPDQKPVLTDPEPWGQGVRFPVLKDASRCNVEELVEDSMRSIPDFQIKKFDEMPVIVTHVLNPGWFYIQHKESNLEELSEIMANTGCESYAEQKRVPGIGDYVAGWISEQGAWCRGQVVKICGMHTAHGTSESEDRATKSIVVEITRVDYGDCVCVSLRNVKELCTEAAAIPAQALQVALAEVSPLDEVSWSELAVSWFKDKVGGRTLYARLYPEGRRVEVELFMERGKIGAMRRGASLSLRLTQNGHSRHKQFKNMQLRRSAAQEHLRKQSVEWEKYLISCYSQNKK